MNDDLALIRSGLWPFSLLYGLAMSARNALFDLGIRPRHRVDVPVVSIGNLAAGGTGKTPLVVWLVGWLRAQGLRPGVLARGYGRRRGAELNDEGMLLARRFPGLCQVQSVDRVAGARRLAAAGVDLILVDDGFQHRRLWRDFDLVCIDTEKPFAGGMLPTGMLREFPRGLRRADAIVLTRAGGFTDEAIGKRLEQLRGYGGEGVHMLATDHRPARLLEMPGGTELGLPALSGTRVHLLSGIARPESFAAMVSGLGAEVVAHHRRRDHHLHSAAELQAISEQAVADGATLVTTEKDEVKLEQLPQRRWVLELDLEFLGAVPELSWLGVEARPAAAKPGPEWIRPD